MEGVRDQFISSILLKTVALIFCAVHRHSALSVAVDVARNKPITAEITCGAFGEETYFGHSQIFFMPSRRNMSVCYNTSTHPATAMVDGQVTTWWQSTARSQLISSDYGLNGKPEAVITLDLEQYFETERIIIHMADSKRPEHMTLLKSVDGVNYTPWIYRVTDEQQCTGLYNVPVLASPTNLDSRICQTYKSGSLGPSRETIEFDLSDLDGKLAAWRNLRYLKIHFYQMDLTLGINGGKFQHYTVSQLEVFAECVCNGHDLACEVNNGTGQYQCVCGGQTAGDSCEMCHPFYNQQAFFYGRPCEACNCFNHSTSCFYDATIANLSLSYNANGVRNGGGVCINCQNNTAGVNCEKCKSLHYRPVGVDQRSVNACLSCDCHGPGVQTNPETGLTGDCVMNDDNILPIGMVPGDCYCKSNVTGKKCDQCKFGSYDLSPDNPNGCTDCGCDTRGTVGGTPMCNISNGKCPCKALVQGQHCDECFDEYYGLDTLDIDGCKQCICDVGASQTTICNKETGQCPCRRNVGERRCTQPLADYYYPDPHFLHGEFEDIRGSWDRSVPGFSGFGYATLSETVPGITYITIPSGAQLTGRYYLLLRYGTLLNVTGSLFVFASGVSTIRSDVMLPACPRPWCFMRLGASTDYTLNLIQGKIYTLRISVTNRINMDKAVLLPWEFTNGTVPLGSSTAAQFQQRCDIYSNDLKLGTADEQFCLINLFSLTTYYLNGALSCDCHFLGSVANTTCDAFGGQCQCKLGVGGRKCDECLLEYYNLGANGCQACECDSDFKVCDSNTGFCVCPPNVLGRKCDHCVANHWNWTSLHGCEPCECDPVGSVAMQCNLTSGLCMCKSGVGGSKCQQCEANFKSFSTQGCVSCGCDPDGTTSAACNDATGQCPCKTNTAGLLCDRCRQGAFNNNADHPDGCLACICMGITDQCGSTTWRNKQIQVPVASNGGTNKTTNFDIVTESDTMIMDLKIVQENGIYMAEALIGSQPRQYWAPIDGLRGNLLPLYEKQITFTVRYDSVDASGLPLLNNRLLIMGARNGSRFYLKVPTVQYDTTTQINVTVSETNLLDTQENVTRGELLLALQDVIMVLIPASYYDRMHTSRIGNIKYDFAASDGTGSQALSVEQCQCPAGYEGLSCERCVTGYLRKDVDTQGYLGVCVPCECNSHATTCNPNTGVCINCQHNTVGDNCEICNNGYYGSALLGTPFDCLTCPCFPPRVENATCTLIGGQVRCLYCAEGYKGTLCDECDQFYFGNPEIPLFGKCERCSCNNNSMECNDRNGACLNCMFNTTGVNCELCVPGTFGNASNQDCRDCACDRQGSHSLVCNSTTGQCNCFNGVGGRTCDTCLPDQYGYTDTSFQGCIPCECNPFGSASTQCQENGNCLCLPNAQGNKCDACAVGFWGLPNVVCSACACDPVGSVDPTEPCELVSGQCRCKPGVGGRQCDRCLFLHVNFGSTGCTACSVCQFSIGNDTKALQLSWEMYWSEVQLIGEVQGQGAIMQDLANQINATMTTLGISEGRLDVLTMGLRNLTTMAPIYNRTVEQLLSRVNSLEDRAARVDNASADELTRQQTMQQQAEEALARAATLNSTAPAIITNIQGYKTAADQLLIDSGRTSSGLDVNVNSEKRMITAVLTNVTTTAYRANTIHREAQVLANQTTNLNNLTSDAERQLNDLDAENKLTDRFISVVKAKADVVWDAFNTSKYYKLHAEALFAEAQSLITLTEAILGRSLANYDLAMQMLADTEGILRGMNNGRLPVDPTLLSSDQLAGIWSWEQASKQLDSEINATLNRVLSREPLVLDIVNRAQNLTLHSQALVQEFGRVQAFGEKAVDAIKNYETVAETLDKSVTMALQANRTVALVMDMLRGVSVTNLERQANASLAESKALLVNVLRQQVTIDVLARQLRTANASLGTAVLLWTNAYNLANVFLQAATAIRELAQEPLVAEPIEASYVAADVAIETGQVVSFQDRNLQPQIERQAQMAAVIQRDNQNATNLANTLDRQLSSLQNVLNNEVQRTLDQTNILRNETVQQRRSLEEAMAAIEAKVERARLKLLQLEQPVGFSRDQYEVVHNPGANVPPMVHTELVLSFQLSKKVTAYGTGVLIFMENNQTSEFIMLHFIERKLVFDFNNGEELLRIYSRANICSGCWFKVIATRYGIDGHLTVIKLETGGVDTTHTRGYTLDDRLTLNTPVYIGGLPPAYQTNKITVRDGNFEGCVTNAHINGEKLELWASVLRWRSTAQCCAQPPTPPRPKTIAGFTTSGFGFVSISSRNFSISSQSHVQFQFRTFDPSGVMLLIDRDRTGSYYGLFMTEGRVLFAYGSVTWVSSLQTIRSYNDGEWYQLTAMHNRTYTMLVLEHVDKSLSTQVEVRSAPMVIPMDLTDLQDATLTFGGENPQTDRHGPVTDFFAACIQNVRFLYPGDADMTSVDVLDIAVAQSGVSAGFCFQRVIPGLGFSDKDSYARLYNLRMTVSVVEFTFQTYAPSGIFMYGQRPEGRPPYFYIALFNGDIFVQFNQGLGIQAALRTRGLYLSEGREHTVHVDFSYQNNPRLTVNGAVHHGAVQMTPNIAIAGGPIYLGGVPNTVTLDAQLPTHDSLIGGLQLLQINGQLIDLYSSTRLDIRLLQGAWLSGLPLPPVDAPPLPYSTTPAPPTTAHPTCATPLQHTFSNTGIRFGHALESYIGFNTSMYEGLFYQSFTITVEFRAVQPNGILIYAADTINPNPTYYISLFMEDGHLVFSMDSNSAISNGNPPKRKGIRSLLKYNDGRWWEVTVLRINDFIAMVVTANRDYKNNGVQSTTLSTLVIKTLLYVGGVPSSVVGLPFGRTQDISIGNIPFHGCIRKVEVATHDPLPVVFDLGNPTKGVGTLQCFNSVKPGVFLNGTTSSVRIGQVGSPDVHDVVPGFNFNMTFQGTVRDGTLVVAYRAFTNFFLVEIFNGLVRGVLSDRGNRANPFIFTSTRFLGSYALCDNNPHSVHVTLTRERAELMVDNIGPEYFRYPPSFSFAQIFATPIYVGGLGDPTWIFPVQVSGQSFQGCIIDFYLNRERYILAEMDESVGVFSGCPG